MRESINTLVKILILLVCSVAQLIEIIFRGISDIFWKLSELLDGLSDRMMSSLDKGKFEEDVETVPGAE